MNANMTNSQKVFETIGCDNTSYHMLEKDENGVGQVIVIERRLSNGGTEWELGFAQIFHLNNMVTVIDYRNNTTWSVTEVLSTRQTAHSRARDWQSQLIAEFMGRDASYIAGRQPFQTEGKEV